MGTHRTLPDEKRIPELFGDIQTTQLQWISDTKWLPVHSGDCEQGGGKPLNRLPPREFQMLGVLTIRK
jgi:hypothetical protein